MRTFHVKKLNEIKSKNNNTPVQLSSITKVVWKFVKMITDGIDKTADCGNDRLRFNKNGTAYLLSDGLRFDGNWSYNNKNSIIYILLYAKYSCEQSGMGYSSNFQLRFKGTLINITDKEIRIQGTCDATVEEWYYGSLPTLPSRTEMVYPFEWKLYSG